MAEHVPQNLTFHYQKSAQYRVIHADGAWGGITPKHTIFLSFFSERMPIPTQVTHKIEANGAIGPEVAHEGKEGLIREVEVGVMLDEVVASSLIAWLQQHLVTIKQLNEQASSEKERVEATDKSSSVG